MILFPLKRIYYSGKAPPLSSYYSVEFTFSSSSMFPFRCHFCFKGASVQRATAIYAWPSSCFFSRLGAGEPYWAWALREHFCKNCSLALRSTRFLQGLLSSRRAGQRAGTMDLIQPWLREITGFALDHTRFFISSMTHRSTVYISNHIHRNSGSSSPHRIYSWGRQTGKWSLAVKL
jgi:hypothetical protein